jgi:hypothetical protein
MAAPRQNEFAKREYEPIDSVEHREKYQNHDALKDNVNPSAEGVGHGIPDPWRHLDETYTHKYPNPSKGSSQKDI